MKNKYAPRYLNNAEIVPVDFRKAPGSTSEREWFSVKNQTADAADVYIYDEISPYAVSAKGVVAQLNALKAVPTLNVRINSPGGSVFEGVAIYNALCAHPGTVDVYIDGLAASIASVIAMAGKTINIAENAMMMIHNPSAVVWGQAKDLRQQADVLDQIRETLINTYVTRTGGTRKAIGEQLDAETWFTAKEAVAGKFADKCVKGMKAAACFDLKQYNFLKAPEMKPVEDKVEEKPLTTPHALRLRRVALLELEQKTSV